MNTVTCVSCFIGNAQNCKILHLLLFLLLLQQQHSATTKYRYHLGWYTIWKRWSIYFTKVYLIDCTFFEILLCFSFLGNEYKWIQSVVTFFANALDQMDQPLAKRIIENDIFLQIHWSIQLCRPLANRIIGQDNWSSGWAGLKECQIGEGIMIGSALEDALLR